MLRGQVAGTRTGSRGAAGVVKLGLGGLVAATALFWLAGLLDGPVASVSMKLWPPERQGDKLIGAIEGAVKAVDSATSTVRVAWGFLGLATRRFVITPETTIAVNGKLGGLGDLTRHQLVRVAYEIFPDRLLATRVDVLDRWSHVPEAVAPVEADDDAVAAGPPRVLRRSSSQGGRTTTPASTRPAPSPTVPLPIVAPDTWQPPSISPAATPPSVTTAAPRSAPAVAPRAADVPLPMTERPRPPDAVPTKTDHPSMTEQAP